MRLLKIILSLWLLIGISAMADSDKASKSKGLPPGLQKNVQAGKPLPTGWQKKLKKGDILDKDIYDRGVILKPVDKDGIVTIKIDNEVLQLVSSTRKIVDILSGN